MDISLDKTHAFNLNSRESNEFIKCFHQSRIPNLQIFFMNICDAFSSTGKLRKNVFWTNKKFILFSNYSNWVNFVGKNQWNKLGKTSDELVTWSGYFCAFSIDFLYPWCIEANETWFSGCQSRVKATISNFCLSWLMIGINSSPPGTSIFALK